MATVYLSAKLPKVATEILNKAAIHYEVFDGKGLISKDELIKHVKDCKVLITPLSTQVDQEVIDAAPKLKLIANFGAGFNNIDVKYARSKGSMLLIRHLFPQLLLPRLLADYLLP